MFIMDISKIIFQTQLFAVKKSSQTGVTKMKKKFIINTNQKSVESTFKG